MLQTQLDFQNRSYQLKRYPYTNDASLRAWNTANLLALQYVSEFKTENIHLFNDRFGVWNCVLNDKKLTTVWTYASQQKAIQQNLELNNLKSDPHFKTPLDTLDEVDVALVQIPKSLELFELFLNQIHGAAHEQTTVVCCFMTKYFSNSFIKLASQYFETIEQTKAWKKARLLVLKNPVKLLDEKEYINKIPWKNEFLEQYYGVFSSGKIDIGTQFLLQYLQVKSNELNVLDVASGNGIIAHEVVKQNPDAYITLVDDFNLAIESSKMNVTSKNTTFLCANTLENLKKEHFDLLVSNPPFHFEHENNIDIAISLFKEVRFCLKPSGRFVLVANKHLNYKTHLELIFTRVTEVAANTKFIIYEAVL